MKTQRCDIFQFAWNSWGCFFTEKNLPLV